MNKLILAALIATVSGAALAKDAAPPAGATGTMPATAAPATTADPAMTTDPAMPPAAATPPAAAGQEMNVPAGSSVTVNPDKAAMAPTPDATASADVPPCSRTVTDRCMQTNEGHPGAAMHRKHHARPHHKK